MSYAVGTRKYTVERAKNQSRDRGIVIVTFTTSAVRPLRQARVIQASYRSSSTSSSAGTGGQFVFAMTSFVVSSIGRTRPTTLEQIYLDTLLQ